MAKYMDKDIGARGVDPHVYAMGEASYKHVRRFKTPGGLPPSLREVQIARVNSRVTTTRLGATRAAVGRGTVLPSPVCSLRSP